MEDPTLEKSKGRRESSPQHTSDDTQDFFPILQILQEARHLKGLTLQDISDRLHLSLTYMEALEKGHVAELPEDVYTLGFVRSYAHILGLDAEKCVKDYKEQILKASSKKQVFFGNLPMPKESMVPKKIILVLSILTILLGGGLWIFFSGDSEEDSPPPSHATPQSLDMEEEPSLELEEPEDPTPDIQPEPEPEPEREPEPEQNHHHLSPAEGGLTPPKSFSTQETSSSGSDPETIKIIAHDRSWVEIKEGEKILYRGILNKGEEYTLKKGPQRVLNTGNAGGISLSGEGITTPVLGNHGQVLRKVPLTKESLLEFSKGKEDLSASLPMPSSEKSLDPHQEE